jgi:hypothetical protein
MLSNGVIESAGLKLPHYIAQPAGHDGPLPGLIICHSFPFAPLVGANQANVTPDGRFQVPVGTSFGLAGSGFGEEEAGEFVVMSTPTLVAEFATAEDGTFEKSAALPASIGAADHTLVVATGSTYAILGIQVVHTTLPVIGDDNDLVVVFALFTLVFGALLIRSRRTLLVSGRPVVVLVRVFHLRGEKPSPEHRSSLRIDVNLLGRRWCDHLPHGHPHDRS